MNNFKVFKTVHFSEEWAKQITSMHHKEHNTTKGTYMYYNVVNMNYDPKHHFYILGVLDEQVIASCFVSTFEDYINEKYIELFDEFLLSSLIVDKDYQRMGYGTKFMDSIIKILKEENAIKIAAFGCENSRKLFENFGFIKDEKRKSFGSTIPGDDSDVYYELNLESNFYMVPINKDDLNFVSASMMREFHKHFKNTENLPFILLPNGPMYRCSLMNNESFDNASVKIVRCNKIAAGYAHMYYHDFDTEYGQSDHSVHLAFYLDEVYLYRSAVKVMVEEAIEFFKSHKQNNNIECIKVNLDKYSILMERYDFYKECLLELGFIQKDNALFIKNVE
ncbi:MAG: GNAT family N-acetyltransferase [Bacilli bacterium]|nr:GNAT family N-acetyltransferase [Bacilli bacterium]